MYDVQKFEETRNFAHGFVKYDIAFPLMKSAWEFCLVYFNVPALVWYWWLAVFARGGHCDVEDKFG